MYTSSAIEWITTDKMISGIENLYAIKKREM